jgi:hypothetical protein
MIRVSKPYALILTLIIAISCLTIFMVKPANAQTIPKPTEPEFTLKVVSHPYDVAPETTIDPYTGKTVITQEGYHTENKSIEIMIRNQPFSTYTNEKDNVISLCYNFTFKGHYGNDWTTYKDPHFNGYVNATNSEYTIVSIPLLNYELGNVREGGELDFKVEALIGYQEASIVMTPLGNGFTYGFSGESSGWSSTQTLTIPTSSSDLTITLTFVAVAFLVVVVSLLLFKRHRKTSNLKQ